MLAGYFHLINKNTNNRDIGFRFKYVFGMLKYFFYKNKKIII